jgi:hypothetical protein
MAETTLEISGWENALMAAESRRAIAQSKPGS